MSDIRAGNEYKMPSGHMAEVVQSDEHDDVLLVYLDRTEAVHVTQRFLRAHCSRLGGI